MVFCSLPAIKGIDLSIFGKKKDSRFQIGIKIFIIRFDANIYSEISKLFSYQMYSNQYL